MKSLVLFCSVFALLLGPIPTIAQSETSPASIVCELEELDVKPVPIKRVQPVYPPAMKRLKKRAKVNVEFVISEVGEVVEWKVVKSTNERFNDSAIEAVKQWKFKPGIKDGKRVKARVGMPLTYRLRR